MERLGGFLLCRRLPPERLPPFLSPADILAECRESATGGEVFPQELVCEERLGPSRRWGLISGHHQTELPVSLAVLVRPCHREPSCCVPKTHIPSLSLGGQEGLH